MGFWFYLSCWLGKLRICSCLACVYRVMNARGKFGEHKKCVGVARGVAEISSSFLSALQASQVHPLYSISAQLKAWANSFITERQQGSARRSLLLRILTTPKKKVNKRPYWLVKNTPHLLLWFQREHVIQLTDNCEWKAQNLWEKWRKSKPDELVSLKNVLEVRDPKLSRVLNIQMMFTLPKNLRNVQLASFFQLFFLLPVGSGPKRSMPIEKLGSSSLVSSIFQREGKLHCSLTGRKLWSQVKKMLTSSYLRTGVRN